MGLVDVVADIERNNRDTILKNTLSENKAYVNRNIEETMFYDNPIFFKVREKFIEMNTDTYWNKVVEKSCYIMNNFAGTDNEKKQLIEKLLLEHEKYELAFYTYKDIVENPTIMQEALAKLKKAISNIDKKIAEYTDCQQSLFEE